MQREVNGTHLKLKVPDHKTSNSEPFMPFLYFSLNHIDHVSYDRWL
jgi:hypothetical protein